MPAPFRNYFVVIVPLAIVLATSAWADQNGTKTITPGESLNLDTGAVSTTGGDIQWNGTALIPQGHAALFNVGKYGSRLFKAIRTRSASAAHYSAAPIAGGILVADDVFGVHTNGGHYAKVLVTAAAGGALSLQYTTFVTDTRSRIAGRPAASGPPVFVTAVQNNYSYLLPGVPNYGIAPGSIFLIQGQNLSSSFAPVLQSSAAPGLPQTLNQTSLSVTVNGVTTIPALYYASSTGVAAVLPSTTPVGTGNLTVSYNGNSAIVNIQVVPSAVGLDTLYGNGVDRPSRLGGVIKPRRLLPSSTAIWNFDQFPGHVHVYRFGWKRHWKFQGVHRCPGHVRFDQSERAGQHHSVAGWDGDLDRWFRQRRCHSERCSRESKWKHQFLLPRPFRRRATQHSTFHLVGAPAGSGQAHCDQCHSSAAVVSHGSRSGVGHRRCVL